MNYDRIDYASRPPLPHWVAPGMALALALFAWGGYRYVHAQRALASTRTQLAEQHQALARQAAVSVPARPIPPKERVKAVNDAIASLNVPWPALLGAIETARPPDVALTRVEPRAKDQSVLVTAQAEDMTALIGFMERLARAAPFVKVLPVRQELTVEAGIPRRQATFEARWEVQP